VESDVKNKRAVIAIVKHKSEEFLALVEAAVGKARRRVRRWHPTIEAFAPAEESFKVDAASVFPVPPENREWRKATAAALVEWKRNRGA
jgi:hypothetical protein